MCGISGRYNYRCGKTVSENEIRDMTTTMVHRGPDDEGYYFDGSMAFGFRRLSIIDLATGHQPMSSVDGRLCVVFNGEIFNYRELRAELGQKGHSFRTSSDTEVILYAYAEWGMEFLRRLNGMFGLALWDRESKRLVVARDRYGVKGVYYSLDKDGIVFASELRAIVGQLRASPAIDETSMKLFLKYRYIPAPRSPYEQIRKLAAGTLLVVDHSEPKVMRWHRRDGLATRTHVRAADATEELKGLYRAAVRRHLVSDVPVGLLLSGGVDSSLLLALMSEESADWRTYSVGFGESFTEDELADAEQTANLFGTTHESVTISRADFERALPRVISCLEEPVATASIVPMYFLCMKAREGVKVAMVGQGPDELWGGYSRHLGLRYAHIWRHLSPAVRIPLSRVLSRIASDEVVRRGLFSLDERDRLRRYDKVFSLADESSVSGLFRDGTGEIDISSVMRQIWEDVSSEIEGIDELAGFQLLETTFSLPDELLMYTDKLSMAHSIELRVPYLDPEIVEFASTTPQNLKINLGTRKYLHKRVAAEFLPHKIITRKKRAFASNVVDEWFRGSVHGRFSTYVADPKSKMYEFVNYSRANVLLDEHRRRQRDNHKLLFSLVVLEEWLRSLRY